MRNYQRQKNNPYKLPHNLYMRMLYLVRDYERMKSERKNILHGSPASDGIPCAGIGNPTENKAIKLASMDSDCAAVERALSGIPTEYRKGIMDNICYGSPYPIDADYETYGRWRRRFLYYIAQNLNLFF
ncbi:MAG: hypothetical protein E7504_04165 [Ruminococcus sp.]|nr:hypothetical protein [Ruminococcus sp.]